MKKIFFLFIAGITAIHSSGTEPIKRIVKETLLSKFGVHEFYNNSYTLSSNLRRVGFLIQKNEKFIAVVDTLQGLEYNAATTPVFSPDGNRFAYTAKTGDKWQIVVDNKQEVSLDSGVTINFIRFSPDNKKLLYTINDGKHVFLFFNGIKSKAYDAINENSISFSTITNKIAYSFTLLSKQYNVIDGKEGEAFDQVGFPLLNPNGKQYAYWAINDKKSYVVIDGKKSKPYEAVNSLKYSTDGKHLLYDVKQQGKYLIVLDGIENESYDEIHSYALSPDGSRLAYAIKLYSGNTDEFTAYVVIDGKKEGPYEQVMVRSLQFSPDGKDLIYGVQLPKSTVTNEVKTERDEFEWFVVQNGKEQTRYNMLQGSMIFSPNSLHMAYGGELYLKRLVNIDGREEPPYDDVYHMIFSPDSKLLAYSMKLNGKEFVVVDGNNGIGYDEISGEKEILFDSEKTFHYLAIKGDKIVLVEERIE